MASVRKLERTITSLRKSSKRAREKAGQVVKDIVTTAEVAGTGFGFGLLQGYRGETTVFGVPVDLGTGIGCHLFALLGGTGADEHLKAIGNGALCSYAHTVGRGIGASQSGRSVSGPIEDMYALPEGEDYEDLAGEELTADDYDFAGAY